MVIEKSPSLAYVDGDDSLGPCPKIGILHGKDATLFVDCSVGEAHYQEALDYCQSHQLPPLRYLCLTHFHQDHIGNLSLVDPSITLFSSKNTGRYLDRPFTVIDHEQTLDLGGLTVTLVPVPSLHAKGCLDVLADGFLFVGDALYSRDSGTGLYYNHEIAYEMLKTYQKIPFAVAIPAHQDNEKSKAEVLAYLTALEQSESALH